MRIDRGELRIDLGELRLDKGELRIDPRKLRLDQGKLAARSPDLNHAREVRAVAGSKWTVALAKRKSVAGVHIGSVRVRAWGTVREAVATARNGGLDASALR